MIKFSEKCLQFVKKYGIINLLCSKEAYRSGHNGTDSKSVVLSGTEGSNPSASARRGRPASKKASVEIRKLFIYYLLKNLFFHIKTEWARCPRRRSHPDRKSVV